MDLRLETFLPYRLNRAAAMSSRQFSHIYRHEFGLTVPEWRVLATLGHRGTASATGIGRDSAMHKTKVSRAVASLQQRRWVAREADEADRRLEHLSLTPAGRAAFRSEEHTSELQSLMRISSAVFCLKKKNNTVTTRI